MKIRTNVKAGGTNWNHNEKMATDRRPEKAKIPFFARKLQGKSLVVRTAIKAGACEPKAK